jgi:Tol biopolymer transport system component
MSATALRIAVLGLSAAVTVIAFTGTETASSAAEIAPSSRIVFHSRLKGGNNEIFSMSANGTGLTRLTRGTASDSNPTWSPDGKRVAFESNRHSDRRGYQDSDVFVMNANGSGVRELTFSNRFDGDPAWSRQNTIAFESERNGVSDVYSIRADGSGERRLTVSPAFDGDPAWSPNGRRIAFTSERDGGDRELYVMNADGTNQVRLTTSAGFDQNPSWSPNGRLISFDSMRDGNLEVYVMNADGTNVRRVTDHPAIDAIPSWSQDGSRIAFVSERIAKGQRRLFSVSAMGGQARQLTRGAYDMSPDWNRG